MSECRHDNAVPIPGDFGRGGPVGYKCPDCMADFDADMREIEFDAVSGRVVRVDDSKSASHGAPELCSDCPPKGYQTDKTRCAECPRRDGAAPTGPGTLISMPGAAVSAEVALRRTLQKIGRIKSVAMVIQWDDNSFDTDWSTMSMSELCMALKVLDADVMSRLSDKDE